METFRHQRSPGSERFLGIFSPPDATPRPSAANGASGVELLEDEVFWTGTDNTEPCHSPKPHSPMANPNPSSAPALSKPGFRRIPDRNFGILAALPEDDNRRSPLAVAPFLQRKPSISSASSASTSPSSSSARMIPAIPKPKPLEYGLSVPSGKVYHQSAPVNVPVGPPKPRSRLGELEVDALGADEDGDDDEMLPPHEIVARASMHDSPMTTFSVLEGVGRTLKGRDLRSVRNAVWRKTGFID